MSSTFSKDNLRSGLIEVFGKYAQDGTSVTDQSHITGDLGVDSLSVMEIVAELEERFDLTFPDEDLPSIRTVGDVIQLVERQLSEAGRLS